MGSLASELMHKIHSTNVYVGFVPIMPMDLQGWNSSHTWMREAAETATTIFDVGTWKGASTAFLAQLLQDRHCDGCVIGIDTFLGSAEHSSNNRGDLSPSRHGRMMLYEQFLTNMVKCHVQDIVVPLAQTTTNAAAILARHGIKADLIHIDADHAYESVLNDARAYWRLLKPGGVLIGDDYHESWPTVVKAANQFAEEVGLPLETSLPKWLIRKPRLAGE